MRRQSFVTLVFSSFISLFSFLLTMYCVRSHVVLYDVDVALVLSTRSRFPSLLSLYHSFVWLTTERECYTSCDFVLLTLGCPNNVEFGELRRSSPSRNRSLYSRPPQNMPLHRLRNGPDTHPIRTSRDLEQLLCPSAPLKLSLSRIVTPLVYYTCTFWYH